VTFFPHWVGFVVTPGRQFYSNPVIIDYLTWIQAGLLAGVLLNIYLFWKGRLDLVSRILKLAVSVYTIAVLALLVQGHNAWLSDHSSGGVTDFFTAIEALNWELVGMHAFRIGFAVALIVSIIELLFAVYRLIRSIFSSDISPRGTSLKI
jgi:hypothetical protein